MSVYWLIPFPFTLDSPPGPVLAPLPGRRGAVASRSSPGHSWGRLLAPGSSAGRQRIYRAGRATASIAALAPLRPLAAPVAGQSLANVCYLWTLEVFPPPVSSVLRRPAGSRPGDAFSSPRDESGGCAENFSRCLAVRPSRDSDAAPLFPVIIPLVLGRKALPPSLLTGAGGSWVRRWFSSWSLDLASWPRTVAFEFIVIE